MSKNLEKTSNTLKVVEGTAAKVARIWNVSKRYVNYVMEGKRYHQGIIESYLQIEELNAAAEDIAFETALIKKVKETAPFN